MERTVWLGALILALAACDAQASDKYLGQRLLRLGGQATVNASSGGLPIKPALCFGGSSLHYETFKGDFIPEEVFGFFRNTRPALIDEARPNVTIVDVDSVGQFPAEFNVSVYEPPPDDVVRSEYRGDPRHASGVICAARADHPLVGEAPFYAVRSHCENDDEGPCAVRVLWATRETKRYYAEFYENCPNHNSELGDCTLTTYGDPQVKREKWEYVVGESDMRVLYLAEPAPADSYVAWVSGASQPLAAGFHVFEPADPAQPVLSMSCITRAGELAQADVEREYGDHYIDGPIPEVKRVIDPNYADAANELSVRQLAHYVMELCEQPNIAEVSTRNPVSIEINPDVPTKIPFKF